MTDTLFERAYKSLCRGHYEEARVEFEYLAKDEKQDLNVRADSYYMLGWICYKEPRAINYGQAISWFHRAAEFNQEQAQFCLGEMYEHGGHGLKSNPVDAFFWYSLSVLNLNDTLKDLGSEIWKSIVVEAERRTETVLLKEQKAEVKIRIDKWVASYPLYPTNH